MKMPAKLQILKALTIFGAIYFFAGCSEPISTNQAINSPNRNTNVQNAQNSSPAPLPTFAVQSTPTPTAPPENVNALTNVAVPANQNVNVTVNNSSVDTQTVAVEKLIIPVAGIRREDLSDTFKDSRSEGRVHDAIDIMAPQGTPVLATADGEIARFFDSVRGGITIYQFSRDKKLIYYYAHLQRRADNLQEKQFVKQGTVIGYVGDTGNSGAGNFHLHFAVWTVNDPKRYWDGTNLNPYNLLR